MDSSPSSMDSFHIACCIDSSQARGRMCEHMSESSVVEPLTSAKEIIIDDVGQPDKATKHRESRTTSLKLLARRLPFSPFQIKLPLEGSFLILDQAQIGDTYF
jgi:hypothetical protein